MAINKNKVQLQETVLDSNGHPLSSTDVNPLTSSDCVIMENGMTLEDVMGNDTVIDTPTIMNEDTSFKVGIGDSETKVIDSDVAKMVIEGKTYQNILPKPTTLIMNTDEKEFKINDKIDNSIVLDDNVAEIATVKGQTYVNAVQEESATEYTVLGEDLSGQSITTTGKPEGVIKNATLEGMTLVNTIQEPSGADATVLELDADIDAQYATIDNTVQGGIHGATLKGQTLVNILDCDVFLTANDFPYTYDGKYFTNPRGADTSAWGRMKSVSNLIKPNTNYFFILTNPSDVDIIFESSFNNSTSNIDIVRILAGTKRSYKRMSPNDYNGLYAKFYLADESVTSNIKLQIMIIEYQEGMENWNIPYFEGMQSVKMPFLTTTGKNLFELPQSDEMLEGVAGKYIKLNLKPNTNYTYNSILDKKGNASEFNFYGWISNDINSNFTGYPIFHWNLNKTFSKTFNTGNDEWYFHILSDKQIDDYRDYLINFQLEEGSIATSFESYKSNILTTSEEVELRKIGDVQDELDLQTGKLTQRVGEVVLDGSVNWRAEPFTPGTDQFLRFCTLESVSNCKKNAKGLCDKEKVMQFDHANEDYVRPSTNLIWIYRKDLTTTVEDLKQQLQANPYTVQYELAEPIIRQVDLSIIDQDNNSLKTIQTHPTLTHITTSSNGLTPFVSIPSQLKYPTIIKPSTTYTVQLKQTTVNSEFPLTINLGGTVMAVPNTKFTITTPETLTSQDVIFTGKNNVIGEVVITEGDTTGIEYNYFEGMNDVKSPKMIAVGKNLISVVESTTSWNGANIKSNNDNTITLTPNSDNRAAMNATIKLKTPIKLRAGTQFTYSIRRISGGNEDFSGGINSQLKVLKKDGTTIALSLGDLTKEYFDKVVYKTYTFEKDWDSIIETLPIMWQIVNLTSPITIQIQLEEGTTATSYEPYKGVTIEQSIDSIPLTSDMFEQGGYSFNSTSLIRGMSLQQIPLFNSDTRIKTKTLIKLKPNSTYTINADMSFSYACFNKDGNYLKAFDFCSTFTTDSETHYIVMNLKNSDNSAITPSSLDSLNLTLQEVTDEIVLRSIGDVKDTLNLTRGEYIQRIGEIVFNGSETWSLDAENGSTDFPVFVNFNPWTNGTGRIISEKFPTVNITYIGITMECIKIANGDLYVAINKDKLSSVDADEFKNYLAQNPLTIQYILETPIIHKVNLTNTTKLPSYASTTHYDTIVPSNSLVPNIKIPSTIDYNVAIKPSTQYTIRANTSDNLTVDLGGTTGTLSNGKVTLTTPVTLTHNEVKFSGTGKIKELMVVEGNEIKDNVPFFNGMKNVEMGGIKLVNIARLNKCSALVTANANKTQFTYTSNGETAYHAIYFDSSLLKTNTVYTVFADITTNTSDNVQPAKFQFGYASGNILDMTRGFVGKIKQTITSPNTTKDGLAIVFRPCSSGGKVVIENPMIIEGDWTHLDEIPYIESEMIIEQPIIRSQGKNLFDIKEATTEWGGATIKSNSDNTITYTPNSNNSAALEAGVYFKQPVKVKTGTKYTYSMKRISGGNADFSGSINNQILLRKKDGTITSILGMSDFNTNTFNQTLTAIYSFDDTVESIVGVSPIMYGVRNLTSPIVMQFQLEEGSSATTYEPFKQHTLSSNRVIGYEEDCYYAHGGGFKLTNTGVNSMLADVEGLSIAYVVGGSSNYTFWDKDDVFISGKQYLDTSLSSYDKNGFITVPSNAKYLRFAAGGETNAQPLYKVATVTGELPLRSLPNGVCDTLNLVTGEYVQRVGEVVLDGSSDETWTDASKTSNNKYRFGILGFTKGGKNDIVATNISCDSYIITTAMNTFNENHGISIDENGSMFIYDNIYSSLSLDAYKQYLSQNPITVQYELETPIVRKIGLTAKGVFTEASLGDYDWEASPTSSPSTTRYRTTSAKSLPIVYNTHLFTEDFDVRHFNIDSHGDYEYVSNMEYGQYVNVRRERLESDTLEAFKKWLAQNPIKVGYITWKQTSSSYSNIQKPIFFNNVNVQFMNNNVDIQPTLTLQARSMNSYVLDNIKPSTQYTSKFWHSSYTTIRVKIDNNYFNISNNTTFNSPSTLTNKLLVVAEGMQELMIIEGDVTGKQLPYYKGIRSSFDNADEIEIYSISRNLFDINAPFTKDGSWSTVIEGNSVISTRINDNVNGAFGAGFRINHIKPNTKYILSLSTKEGAIYVYSNSGLWGDGLSLVDYGGGSLSFTTKSDTKYITIGLNYGRYDVGAVLTTTDIKLEEGSVATPYQPHKENSTIINMPMQLETVEVVRPEMENGTINTGNGANAEDTTNSYLRSDFIPVQPKEFIYFLNGNSDRVVNIICYNKDKNFMCYLYNSNDYVPENCYFVRIYMGKANTSDLTMTRMAYKPIALNELPNGVKDELIINRATSSAKLIRRVGKVVLDGFSGGHDETIAEFNFRKFVIYTGLASIKVAGQCVTSNNLPCIVNGEVRNTIRLAVDGKIVINIDGFSSINEYFNYLKQNPLTVYYELAEPVITEIRLKGYPFVYEDGSITLNTDIAPVTRTSYNVNQHQLINSQNETIIRHDKQISDLYDYIEIYLDEIYRMELFKMQLELSL